MANFSCVHTNESFFTNRLYVGLNKDKSEIENMIFSDGKEKKGLGMSEYGTILGCFLNVIGIAFKAKDENGNTLYINKKSFCHLADRLHNNNQKYNFFNADSIEAEYNAKNDDKPKQSLYNTFNYIFSRTPDRNISKVSINMLAGVSQM